MKNLEEYFADRTAISNSQLRNFVKYDKYDNRTVTPDIYYAYDNDFVKFQMTDAVVLGKMVDLYFDKSSEYFENSEKLFEKYIPVARRT